MTLDATVDLGRGLVLPNAVGLASGTAGYGFELRDLIPLDLLGALYTKGTTPLPRSGNAPPRLAEVGAGVLNSIGLQNPGVDHVVEVYCRRYAGWSIPIIVNVAGGDVDDYLRCAERLEAVPAVSGLELNISCPNIAHGLDFGTRADAAAGLVAAVRQRTQRCLIVKLSPNVSNIGEIARAVADAGADAVSAVNTYIGMKISLETRRPVLPRAGTGGLSGPSIRPLGLAAVAAVRRAVEIPVIGVGGIATATDALEYFVAGADAVQVGTATFVHPAAAIEVLAGVREYADTHGLSRLTELRWSAAAEARR